MSESDEIFEKIENEHRQGGHATGPQAGCRLCIPADDDDPVGRLEGGDSTDDVIASMAAARAKRATSTPNYKIERTLPPLPSAEEIASWGDERTLGDVALMDAEGILAALDQQSAGLSTRDQLTIRAQVAQVRALAAVEEQLGRLVSVMVVSDVEEGVHELPPQDEALVEQLADPPELEGA